MSKQSIDKSFQQVNNSRSINSSSLVHSPKGHPPRSINYTQQMYDSRESYRPVNKSSIFPQINDKVSIRSKDYYKPVGKVIETKKYGKQMSKLYSPQLKNPRLLKPQSGKLSKPVPLYDPKQQKIKPGQEYNHLKKNKIFTVRDELKKDEIQKVKMLYLLNKEKQHQKILNQQEAIKKKHELAQLQRQQQMEEENRLIRKKEEEEEKQRLYEIKKKEMELKSMNLEEELRAVKAQKLKIQNNLRQYLKVKQEMPEEERFNEEIGIMENEFLDRQSVVKIHDRKLYKIQEKLKQVKAKLDHKQVKLNQKLAQN